MVHDSYKEMVEKGFITQAEAERTCSYLSTLEDYSHKVSADGQWLTNTE